MEEQRKFTAIPGNYNPGERATSSIVLTAQRLAAVPENLQFPPYMVAPIWK